MNIHVNRQGQSLGKFGAEEIRQGYTTGRFLPTDLVWRDGMEAWRPLGEVIDEIAPAAAAPETAASSGAVAPVIDGDRTGPAWEKREELGVFAALVETIRSLLFEPARTFAAMRAEGGFGPPLLFYVILNTVMGIVGVFYQAVYHSVAPPAAEQADAMTAVYQSPLGIAGMILLMPLLAIVFAFVYAGLLHVSLWIVGGAKRPFEATFRVSAYAGGATSVFQLLPMCGWVIALVYYLVLLVMGFVRVQHATTGRAVVAALLPFIVCCGVAAAAVLLIVGETMGAVWQAAGQ